MYTLYLSDYEITKNGDVINKKSGKKVKGQPNGKGYLRVSISGKLQFIHRLVAEKYIPNPENKPQVNHKDGNKRNNSVENLEWVDNKTNREHAVKNKLHRYGENSPSAKLKEKDVIEIRKLCKQYSNKEVAQMFNVSPSTISGIKNMRTWKTVENLC